VVLTGNPGTWKTTVARLLGELLRDAGVLGVGHVHEVTPSGMIAGYVGQTRRAIETAVASALDGVLFLDEAYQLSDERNGFGAEAITTLTQLMERERERLCVVIAGYRPKIKELLAANQGLARRFPEHYWFDLPDYTDPELHRILVGRLSAEGLTWDAVTDRSLATAARRLRRRTPVEEFGNAGAMENLADEIHGRWSRRTSEQTEPLIAEDIPPSLRPRRRSRAS
jgi:SpoVK/Ycf46/Vps4 family AAA+-type ATPase